MLESFLWESVEKKQKELLGAATSLPRGFPPVLFIAAPSLLSGLPHLTGLPQSSLSPPITETKSPNISPLKSVSLGTQSANTFAEEEAGADAAKQCTKYLQKGDDFYPG